MKTRDLLFAAVMAFSAVVQAAPAPATAQHALSSDSADANQPVWENFNLDGSLSNRNAAFVLSGTVRVKNSKGGSIPILSGAAALTSVPDKGEVAFEDGRYALKFKKSGTYPVHIQFNAKVTVQDGWNCINFDTVPASLRPVTLKGLPADTQFQFAGAAKPERRGDLFTCFLPVAGGVQLRWKEARTEELGKLFFSAEGAVSVEVSPGLLRQTHAFDIKVMQGELSQIVFDLAGEGEVSRVTADNLLGWKIEPGPDKTRRLIAQFNQARKDECWVMIQAQTPLGAFPSRIQPLRVTPEGAIRYGGHLLIANNGAVRLEVTETKGLSQISPELFPRIEGAGETVAAQRTQSFAYRFSGADFGLAIQADNILPELAVSQMLIYTLAETETSIDAEIELEIREAPLREFTLEIPSDYTVSRLNAAQLSDHTVSPSDKPGRSRLKMLFAAPLTGRLVAQLRLEKNQNLAPGAWPLPEMTPQNVKSARGYVGVAADTGLRATASQTSGLTEIAGAFFPRKVAGLQYSARIKDDQWSATVNVERLALSVQADATHLFTVNQGIAYGSSILHYMISGAPVSSLRVAIPEEYGNVEFSGRDVRNWKKTSDGYEVFLQTPAFGAYTLLAAYDRQFNAQSNTVSFAGATPLDARSEQGTVLVASQQQLQVKPVTVSPGLIALEPAEIPAEHRLLFDAPLLAAYQYAARPFTLQLALQSLAVGETVRQAVDRAEAETRISREGETVTTARYYVKSQGHSHLQLTLPEGVQLWEATVNGQKVAPASDKGATLIPLPARADPSAILTVEVKLASKSADKKLVRLSLPAIDASVLLTQWTLNPDEKYRLEYRNGSFAPPVADVESGFDILRLYIQDKWIALSAWFGVLLAVLAAGSILARRAARPSVYRWSRTYWLALIPGMLCFASVISVLGVMIAGDCWEPSSPPASVALSAPIQAAGSFLTATVANFEAAKAPTMMWKAWPALLGLAAWAWAWIGAQGFSRAAGILAGWLFVAWGALSLPDGLPFFLGTLMAFILAQIVVPSARILWNAPRRPKADSAPPPAANPAAAALVLLGILGGFSLNAAPSAAPMATDIAQIEQKARATNGFVFVSATMTWKAEAGQRIAFLRAPGVLTRVDLPPTVKLDPSKEDPTGYWITASSTGSYRIGFDYEVPISTANGFALPTPCGAVNRLDLTVEKADVEVLSDYAVSIQTGHANGSTQAQLVLTPTPGAIVFWRPRPRDTQSEQAVFYAEFAHLFIPAAGAMEGIHDAQIRPAQGQLDEVSFDVPAGVAITDVQISPAQGQLNNAPAASQNNASVRSTQPLMVLNWRFDPDRRILRAQLNRPQSKPFALRIHSQRAAPPLPYQATNGFLSMPAAAGQVGVAGIATGGDVQLDDAQAPGLSVINIEDFPADLVADASAQVPGLALRRAFRYSTAGADIVLSASAVRPDVRVESQDTLSLGEDRALLASQLAVHIARAGIFKLSFVLPADFEIESLTGPALSHWTELKEETNRIITLNLRGKTEGSQSFSVALSGPGVGKRAQWEAPRLAIREAAKQTGQLVLAPELGARIHVNNPDGVSQLDPKKAGAQQKGALAFRLLRADWRIPFEIETVEPWIQVSSLQDVTFREGQARVSVQLDYQIENAGVKSLLFQIPASAENVRFEGDQIADWTRGASADGRADWELKLQRRVIGTYSTRMTYQLSMSNSAENAVIASVNAKNANLQRAWLALRPTGRLQLNFPQIPAALQRADWQSIPAALRRNRGVAESKDAFSAVETTYELPVSLSRHEIAKVLPARVESASLSSVLSPGGEVLTEGRLELRPGDKRLLRLKLPPGGKFWYAFVNGQSAPPWREGDQVLLLLEKNSNPSRPAVVEFFYTSPATPQAPDGFKTQISGPSFDLPLENITWEVYLPETQEIKRWQSSLQLVSDEASPEPIDINAYLQKENARLQARSTEAETMLQMGNSYLQQGTPGQARQAYQSAWKLSPQDAALNEDARVQLHNLKTQQALLGMNARRMDAFEQPGASANNAASVFNRREPGQAPEYTQQQAQMALEQNRSEDNVALTKVAERVVNQQDAGAASADAIRASLPAQGRRLTFKGSLQVNEWADMQIKLDTRPENRSHVGAALLSLAGILACLGLFMALAPRARNI